MRFQHSQNARHRGQHRNALAVDLLDQPRRCQPALEMHLGLEKRRNPKAHGLAEDVAQRQRVQNAQRMNQPLVAHVGLGAVFDWDHAGQHIAVRENDAFGVARSARM